MFVDGEDLAVDELICLLAEIDFVLLHRRGPYYFLVDVGSAVLFVVEEGVEFGEMLEGEVLAFEESSTRVRLA